MKILSTLFFVLTLLGSQDTIVTYHPTFTQNKFFEGDSMLFADFYNLNNIRLYPDTVDYITNADSCNVYIVYDINGSFHPMTVLNEHRKKLIETYVRKSKDSWLHITDTFSDIVYEERSNIISTDTVYVENPWTFELETHVTHFYNLTKR